VLSGVAAAPQFGQLKAADWGVTESFISIPRKIFHRKDPGLALTSIPLLISIFQYAKRLSG